MNKRAVGPFTVNPIGLGCMNMCAVYGPPPSFEDAERLLLTALDEGVDFFDTAALYGFGESEKILARSCPSTAAVLLWPASVVCMA